MTAAIVWSISPDSDRFDHREHNALFFTNPLDRRLRPPLAVFEPAHHWDDEASWATDARKAAASLPLQTYSVLRVWVAWCLGIEPPRFPFIVFAPNAKATEVLVAPYPDAGVDAILESCTTESDRVHPFTATLGGEWIDIAGVYHKRTLWSFVSSRPAATPVDDHIDAVDRARAVRTWYAPRISGLYTFADLVREAGFNLLAEMAETGRALLDAFVPNNFGRHDPRDLWREMSSVPRPPRDMVEALRVVAEFGETVAQARIDREISSAARTRRGATAGIAANSTEWLASALRWMAARLDSNCDLIVRRALGDKTAQSLEAPSFGTVCTAELHYRTARAVRDLRADLSNSLFGYWKATEIEARAVLRTLWRRGIWRPQDADLRTQNSSAWEMLTLGDAGRIYKRELFKAPFARRILAGARHQLMVAEIRTLGGQLYRLGDTRNPYTHRELLQDAQALEQLRTSLGFANDDGLIQRLVRLKEQVAIL